MYKIAVIGDKSSILPFNSVGLDIFIVYEKDEARRTVDRLAKEDYGIIFITEELAGLIPQTIQRYKESLLPSIIPIPSNRGTLGIGMEEINKNVEKAIGSNIL